MKELSTKEKDLVEAKRVYRAVQEAAQTEALKKANNNLAKDAMGDTGHIAAQIKKTETTIKAHQEALADLRSKTTTAEKLSTDLIDSLAIQTKQDRPAFDPEEEKAERPSQARDPFTSIHVSVSQSSERFSTESGSTSFGGKVGANGGYWGVAVAAEHSEAYGKAMKDLASSSVDISFEVMRVDITRPWLFAELFNDSDLRPGPDVLLVVFRSLTFTY